LWHENCQYAQLFYEDQGGNVKKALGLMFVIASSTAAAMAVSTVGVPEINPAVIPTAVALLGGGILVARAYLKK
jgi:hypothetical protein